MFPKLMVALKTLLKFFGSLVFAVVASSVMFLKVLMYFSQGDHRWVWVWERFIGGCSSSAKLYAHCCSGFPTASSRARLKSA